MPPRRILDAAASADRRQAAGAAAGARRVLDLAGGQAGARGVKALRATGAPPAAAAPGDRRGSGRSKRATDDARTSTNGRRGGHAAAATRRRPAGRAPTRRCKLIKANPGHHGPDIADRMGIRQNYLYRVTAELQKQAAVKRKRQRLSTRASPRLRGTGRSGGDARLHLLDYRVGHLGGADRGRVVALTASCRR